MKKSLVLKLLPLTVMAAIGLFLAAKAPPQADASIVGAISPASFTVNAGSPVAFTFTAQAGAGPVSVIASGAASTFINVTSCSGCSVGSNGTSAVSITTPPGTSNFTVGFTLDVSCTQSGIPVSVTAAQGNGSTASGVTGACACNTLIYGGNCGCAVITSNCCTVLTTACNCTYLANAGCGCGSYLNQYGCCGVVASGCGCAGIGTTSTVYLNGVLTNNCGCGGYGYGAPAIVTGGVYTGGIYGGGVYGGGVYGGGVYGANNCGICATNGLLANCGIGTSQVAVTVPGTAVCGSRFNVLVTVRNSIGGLALEGTQVSLQSNMGVISPATTVTSGGIASASLLLPPAGAGNATIAATANGVSGQASVVVSCAAAPVVIPAPVPVVIQVPIISAPNAGDGGCLAKGGCN